MSKEEEVCNNKEGESVAAVASPRKNEVDMLHGPLLGKILMFAMPFALSGVLEQLFNSVDVMVVGRFASSDRRLLHRRAESRPGGALPGRQVAVSLE